MQVTINSFEKVGDFTIIENMLRLYYGENGRVKGRVHGYSTTESNMINLFGADFSVSIAYSCLASRFENIQDLVKYLDANITDDGSTTQKATSNTNTTVFEVDVQSDVPMEGLKKILEQQSGVTLTF